ncbi:hypothetical protein [Actinomadura chibensis]|uniref:Uncharacterized protein n=1 Tax=Actinomadura chibensis TaxID=392828 RepID=A0A5D0NGJ2_9ACTN|nr:hypothetical protein [Actinomadura chibensis]TYB43586.1 hypothetical protein FXF69_27770 [Actinomadura chibensis]
MKVTVLGGYGAAFSSAGLAAVVAGDLVREGAAPGPWWTVWHALAACVAAGGAVAALRLTVFYVRWHGREDRAGRVAGRWPERNAREVRF